MYFSLINNDDNQGFLLGSSALQTSLQLILTITHEALSVAATYG